MHAPQSINLNSCVECQQAISLLPVGHSSGVKFTLVSNSSDFAEQRTKFPHIAHHLLLFPSSAVRYHGLANVFMSLSSQSILMLHSDSHAYGPQCYDSISCLPIRRGHRRLSHQ
ncbi:hypothetical protein ABKN59_001335 [Abortiporus biennis]